MIPLEERCNSLQRSVIKSESGRRVEVYLRCSKTADHESPNHKSWLKKWYDENESGWIEWADEVSE